MFSFTVSQIVRALLFVSMMHAFATRSLGAGKGDPQFWHKGSVESALAKAKTSGQGIFIYWGAQWCPPCNEMKAQVFSQKGFQDAIKDMVAVMIDGDSKDAQKWSEHFSASGYPTLLFLSSDLTPRLRFVGYTPLPTMLAALASLKSTDQSLIGLAQKAARKEPLNPQEWRILAFSDWSSFTPEQLSGIAPTELALSVNERMPSDLKAERALMAVFILANAAEAEEKWQDRIRNTYADLMNQLKTPHESAASVIDFLGWGAPALKSMIPESMAAEERQKRIDIWKSTVTEVSKLATDSLNDRLNIASAHATLTPLDSSNPAQIAEKRKVLDGLNTEMISITDDYQLVSMIPKLADAYYAIGDYDKAISVLEKRIPLSKVPYYFMGHIAAIQKDLGHLDKALEWREKALRASKGSSTRIQWTWAYLSTLQSSAVKDRDKKMEQATIDILKMAAQQQDGFFGRNFRYLSKVADLINEMPTKSNNIISTIGTLKKQCAQYKDENRKQHCDLYFSKINLASSDFKQ